MQQYSMFESEIIIQAQLLKLLPAWCSTARLTCCHILPYYLHLYCKYLVASVLKLWDFG